MKSRISHNRILRPSTAPLLLCLCLFLTAWTCGAVCAAGEDPLGGTVFFGESTTAHLSRDGGVLDTPAGRRHVLRDGSGTRLLDRRILSSPVDLENEDGSVGTVAFSEALTALAPKRIVLSFGLNGLRAHAKEPQKFLSTYRRLIDGIRDLLPESEIIIQSVYPVGENTVFSADVATVNREIDLINKLLKDACASWGDVSFIDTAACLRDADGTLSRAYDAGDGIHLTNEAYERILPYFFK